MADGAVVTCLMIGDVTVRTGSVTARVGVEPVLVGLVTFLTVLVTGAGRGAGAVTVWTVSSTVPVTSVVEGIVGATRLAAFETALSVTSETSKTAAMAKMVRIHPCSDICPGCTPRPGGRNDDSPRPAVGRPAADARRSAARGCLMTPRVRLASAGSSEARTQGGCNSSAIAPTEDAASRRSAAARRARGVVRQPLGRATHGARSRVREGCVHRPADPPAVGVQGRGQAVAQHCIERGLRRQRLCYPAHQQDPPRDQVLTLAAAHRAGDVADRIAHVGLDVRDVPLAIGGSQHLCHRTLGRRGDGTAEGSSKCSNEVLRSTRRIPGGVQLKRPQRGSGALGRLVPPTVVPSCGQNQHVKVTDRAGLQRLAHESAAAASRWSGGLVFERHAQQTYATSFERERNGDKARAVRAETLRVDLAAGPSNPSPYMPVPRCRRTAAILKAFIASGDVGKLWG